jgi:hypothetical protein
MTTTHESQTSSASNPSIPFSPEAKALADLTATVHRALKRYLPFVLVPLGIAITRFTWEVAMVTSATFTDIAPDISWGPRDYVITYRDAEKRSKQRLRLDGTVLSDPEGTSKGNPTQDEIYREVSSLVRILPATIPITPGSTASTTASEITLALTANYLAPNYLTITSSTDSPTTVNQETHLGTLSTFSLFGLRPRVVLKYQTPDLRYLVVQMNSRIYLVDGVTRKLGLIGQGRFIFVGEFGE